MSLPEAPIAQEGFFVTHFFTVRGQEKSKDFYVRILGGKVIKPDNPCYIKLDHTIFSDQMPEATRRLGQTRLAANFTT
jgi:hypothetical protein